MAERYSAGRQDWVSARHRLIDEVLEYRRTGKLMPSLLDACEAEINVASWPYSEGVKRLVELTRDGHGAPVERLEALMSSKDWRVRYQALQQVFLLAGSRSEQRQILMRSLADRSGRIRSRMATEALFAHLIEAVEELEHAALAERTEENAKEIFTAAYQLRLNERTGERRVFGGEHYDPAACDAAWERLRQANRPTAE